jgi:hypothetical protein
MRCRREPTALALGLALTPRCFAVSHRTLAPGQRFRQGVLSLVRNPDLVRLALLRSSSCDYRQLPHAREQKLLYAISKSCSSLTHVCESRPVTLQFFRGVCFLPKPSSKRFNIPCCLCFDSTASRRDSEPSRLACLSRPEPQENLAALPLHGALWSRLPSLRNLPRKR